MSGRTKKLIAILGAAAVAALVWNLSGGTWSRSGRYPVARKVLQTAGLPGAGEGTYRLLLSVPPDEKEMAEVMVSREIIDAVQEGDVLEYRIRRLPGVWIQAIDFRAQRNNVTAVQWDDGYPFLYGGVGIAGVAGGILLLGITLLAANLLRLHAPPDV
jgi:hypothetical protein